MQGFVKCKGYEPLGPGGDPYPAMYGKPDLDRLDALVGETVRYFREREKEVLKMVKW